jgi:hypothetical protein
MYTLVPIVPFFNNLEIIQRRREAKSKTLQVRKEYNRAVREQGNGI